MKMIHMCGKCYDEVRQLGIIPRLLFDLILQIWEEDQRPYQIDPFCEEIDGIDDWVSAAIFLEYHGFITTYEVHEILHMKPRYLKEIDNWIVFCRE